MTDQFTLGNFLYNAHRLRKFAAGAPASAPKPAAPAPKPAAPAPAPAPAPKPQQHWFQPGNTGGGQPQASAQGNPALKSYLSNARAFGRQTNTGRFERPKYYNDYNNPSNPSFRLAELRWDTRNGYTDGAHAKLIADNARNGTNWDINFGSSAVGNDPRNSIGNNWWKPGTGKFLAGALTAKIENPDNYSTETEKNRGLANFANHFKRYAMYATDPVGMAAFDLAFNKANDAGWGGWSVATGLGSNIVASSLAHKLSGAAISRLNPASAAGKLLYPQVIRNGGRRLLKIPFTRKAMIFHKNPIIMSPLMNGLTNTLGYGNIAIQNLAAITESQQEIRNALQNRTNNLMAMRQGNSWKNDLAALGVNFADSALGVGADVFGTIGGLFNPKLGAFANGELIRMGRGYADLARGRGNTSLYGEAYNREINNQFAWDVVSHPLQAFIGGTKNDLVGLVNQVYVNPAARDAAKEKAYINAWKKQGLNNAQIKAKLNWYYKNQPRFFDAADIPEEWRTMSPVQLLRMGIETEKKKVKQLDELEAQRLRAQQLQGVQ